MKNSFDKEKIDFGGRTWLFKTLVGSHNYNLNTPTSDKDYKVFVAPTFDDLYFSNKFSKLYVSDVEDLDVHDVRKITSLLYKSNVNFMEILFSEEIVFNPEISDKTKSILDSMFLLKNDLAKMNLPYLYNACTGMHLTKRKQVKNGTSGTQDLVDRYGYDTKQAMHSLRILDFLKRFHANDFTNFKKAIWYDDKFDAGEKYFLLGVKGGRYSLNGYNNLADSMFNDLEDNYKNIYRSYEVDEKVNEMLLEMIKILVKENLK